MARRELVTPMMEMTLMILILMEVMMVEMVMVVMVVMMEETVEMGVMIVMMVAMHCWLRGGLRRSTMTWRVMPTTYYHPKLCTLVHRYHAGGTVQYRIEHWTHPNYIGF